MTNTNSDEEFQDALSAGDDTPTSSYKSAKTNELECNIEDIIQNTDSVQLNDTLDETDREEFKPAQITEVPFEELSLEELERLEMNMTSDELKENKEKAERLKLEANDLFKNDKPDAAIDLYTKALNVCPSANTKERAILFANRAAAKIKIDSNKAALEDCTKAIDLYPDYIRCLLRRAKLYEGDDKLDEALVDFKRVCELDPGQREAREAIVRLPPIIQERNEKLKEEMVGKLKDLGNMFLKPFGLSTDNFQMQQDPNSGSYSINFKQ